MGKTTLEIKHCIREILIKKKRKEKSNLPGKELKAEKKTEKEFFFLRRTRKGQKRPQ